MHCLRLETRLLFNDVGWPHGEVRNRALYIDTWVESEKTAIRIENGVAKLSVERVGSDYPFTHRLTLRRRELGAFDRVVINFSAGDDVASVTSDVPVLLYGGIGNDQLTLYGVRSRMFGNDGDDTLISSPPLLSNEPEQKTTQTVARGTVPGKPVDMLAPSFNILEGNAGDDRLETRGGDDEVHGGAGRDTLVKLNSDIRVDRGGVDGIVFVPEARVVGKSHVGTFSIEAIGAPIESNPVLVLYNAGLDNGGSPVSIYPVAPKKR